MYVNDPEQLHDIDAADVDIVADQVANTLSEFTAQHVNPNTGVTEPVWMDSDEARVRYTVWIAAGILTAALRIANPDALALIQAHAYAHNTTIDDIAHRLTTGQLSPDDLHPGESA